MFKCWKIEPTSWTGREKSDGEQEKKETFEWCLLRDKRPSYNALTPKAPPALFTLTLATLSNPVKLNTIIIIIINIIKS